MMQEYAAQALLTLVLVMGGLGILSGFYQALHAHFAAAVAGILGGAVSAFIGYAGLRGGFPAGAFIAGYIISSLFSDGW